MAFTGQLETNIDSGRWLSVWDLVVSVMGPKSMRHKLY